MLPKHKMYIIEACVDNKHFALKTITTYYTLFSLGVITFECFEHGLSDKCGTVNS